MSAAPRPARERPATPRTGRHSAARLAALQALYQIEMTGAPGAQVVDEFVHHRLDRPDDETGATRKTNAKRFGALVRGVSAQNAEIDAAIAPLLAPGWTLGRIEIVLRCILRLGAYELMAMPEIPARVTITEYVALAGDFFSGDEPGVVNGILDRLARRLRPGELDAKPDDSRRSGRSPG